SMNPSLRDAIAKAKANNMPNDNIDRSIKKAIGDSSSENYEDIIYEGYGAGGSAVIVETLTDNKNRTAGEVRHIFDKSGGSLGTSGSVSFMFDRKGIIAIEKSDNFSEDQLFEWILEAEADDMITSEEGYEVFTSTANFSKVKNVLSDKNIEFASAEVEFVPQSYITLDENKLASFQKMLDKFDDNDDVQNVYHNVENVE
ncbi:MAG: YebC/PmpR family DNA-binding transcriptional regulator, partial [Clostridia bacterium]|nr:YebC/PmpR family DNA-binding transcriptional regulator [Clostridia bacterium]